MSSTEDTKKLPGPKIIYRIKGTWQRTHSYLKIKVHQKYFYCLCSPLHFKLSTQEAPIQAVPVNKCSLLPFLEVLPCAKMIMMLQCRTWFLCHQTKLFCRFRFVCLSSRLCLYPKHKGNTKASKWTLSWIDFTHQVSSSVLNVWWGFSFYSQHLWMVST